ncbi:MAG TPA: aspartyl-phosphate phosphatase Spo0E family protein [Clostridia bacterium]|nr:aspartyl-phosphate phosphatase Spo0E family protein [Clostridia bacterium]
MSKIEKTRKLLSNRIQVKGSLTDPEIVFISQQLDRLLNNHQKMIMYKKRLKSNHGLPKNQEIAV